MVEASRPLWQSVKGAAESVIGDPRFLVQPVMLAELEELEIELTILGPMSGRLRCWILIRRRRGFS